MHSQPGMSFHRAVMSELMESGCALIGKNSNILQNNPQKETNHFTGIDAVQYPN